MGNRVSIQFKNGDNLSPILFSHWGGMEFVEEARRYAKQLTEDASRTSTDHFPFHPLVRLEVETVIVDFIRHITQGLDKVSGDLYLVCSEGEGDNSDNGHHIIDFSSPSTTCKV